MTIYILMNLLMPNMPIPKRGVNFERIVGQETNKTRPAIVVSSNSVGILNVRLVVPLTGWNQNYDGKVWLIKIETSKSNGLKKTSAADALATRSVALERFKEKIGILQSSTMNEIATAIALVVEGI